MAVKKEVSTKVKEFLKVYADAYNKSKKIELDVAYADSCKADEIMKIWQSVDAKYKSYLEDIKLIFGDFMNKFNADKYKAYDNMSADDLMKLDKVIKTIDIKGKGLTDSDILKLMTSFDNDPMCTSIIISKLNQINDQDIKDIVLKYENSTIVGKRAELLLYVREIEEYVTNIYLQPTYSRVYECGTLKVPYDVNINDGMGGLVKWSMLDDDFNYIGGEYTYIDYDSDKHTTYLGE